MTHGTASGYNKYACRCELCRDWGRNFRQLRQAANKKLKPPKAWVGMPSLEALLEWAWAVHDKRHPSTTKKRRSAADKKCTCLAPCPKHG